MARYRIDAALSQFTVQAFATGLLSFAAHSPTFTVRDFNGAIRFDPDSPGEAEFTVTVVARGLNLLDQVRPADRQEIEDRMRREVLEPSRYPEVRYASEEVQADETDANRFRLRIVGRLDLHGVSNRQPIDAELLQYADGVRLVGEFPLALSEYGIPPVTALGGAIRLKDRLRIRFDFAAPQEV
jgi:polyisoprenoid-binding protein YceI